MSKKRAPGRSLDEWMELVTECRQSGLTDAAWCNEHGISPSCFYNAVTRLRKKACQIPDPAPKDSSLELTSHKQDVVQIAIEPESSPAGLIPDNGNRPMHLDNSHTIEIEADGLLIRMSNEIKPLLLYVSANHLLPEAYDPKILFLPDDSIFETNYSHETHNVAIALYAFSFIT